MNNLKKTLIILSCLIILTSKSSVNNKADLIVFSYNRPLQLYAFLESVEKFLHALDKISIIYRTSQNSYQEGYDIVKKKFSTAIFFEQKSNDFKTMLITAMNQSKSDYIIFGVDDIIVKDYVNLNTCIDSLQETSSYGFYLRLGKNIIQCYMHNDESTPVPISKQINLDIYQWIFKDGKGDWKYPNTLDMTVYKKTDIKDNILSINFDNPSSLEANWAAQSNYNLTGLYFEESKILNIPLNKVHEESLNIENRTSNYFTTEELLKILNQGLKINIDKFYKFKNLAPHANLIPEFVEIK